MYPRIAQLQTPSRFSAHIRSLGIDLDFDEQPSAAPDSPLARPYSLPPFEKPLSNRWCIQPMEGWDGTPDGRPTELTFRRWKRFGSSGAKLIWGGEAVAVRPDGRANPNQLCLNGRNLPDFISLRESLVRAHAQRWPVDDLVIGLQLTHSGRFCRPNEKNRQEPLILYRHPLLDRKFGLPEDHPLMSDGEVERLVAEYVAAAKLARRAGFDFVDVKHCHGYLGHEFLSAVDRPGKYGGCLENRTRFLEEVAAGIRAEVPDLEIGVRISAFDFIPFEAGPDGVGVPAKWPRGSAYRYAFGGDGTGTGIDLTEPHRVLDRFEALGIRLVNITGGSPYYVPHIQRPALFPPSDGYGPPEDPLAGVARQIRVTADLKARHPGLCLVGSGYSYLQEWLPAVAQRVIRAGQADFIGLGRMVLSYPELCADALAGRPLDRRRICRSFSDCTSAPRKGLVSGCYPLDAFYKRRPEASTLRDRRRNR